MYSLLFARIILPFFLFLSICCNAQDEKGTILLIANTEARVIIDGEEVGLLESNKPQKFSVDPGEHYLQVIYLGKRSLN